MVFYTILFGVYISTKYFVTGDDFSMEDNIEELNLDAPSNNSGMYDEVSEHQFPSKDTDNKGKIERFTSYKSTVLI